MRPKKNTRLISAMVTESQYKHLSTLAAQRSHEQNRSCTISELVRQGVDLITDHLQIPSKPLRICQDHEQSETD